MKSLRLEFWTTRMWDRVGDGNGWVQSLRMEFVRLTTEDWIGFGWDVRCVYDWRMGSEGSGGLSGCRDNRICSRHILKFISINCKIS